MSDKLKEIEELRAIYTHFPTKVKEAILKLLSAYGIKTLGLWTPTRSLYTPWRCADYNKEDMTIFGNLEPDFYESVDWELDGFIYSVGLVIGLRLDKDNERNVILVLAEDEKEYVKEVNFDEYEDYGIDLLEMIYVIINTVKFNLANNISTEKWGLNHFPYVDSYTYEYLVGKAGKDKEKDEEDDGDETEADWLDKFFDDMPEESPEEE